MVQVVWSTRARLQHQIIRLHLEHTTSKAHQICDDLERRINILVKYPRLGRRIDHDEASERRRLIIDNYAVLYEIIEGTVIVNEIKHSSAR